MTKRAWQVYLVIAHTRSLLPSLVFELYTREVELYTREGIYL